MADCSVSSANLKQIKISLYSYGVFSIYMTLQKWIPSYVRLYSTFIKQRIDQWQWFPSLVSILHVHLPELRFASQLLLLEPPVIPTTKEITPIKSSISARVGCSYNVISLKIQSFQYSNNKNTFWEAQLSRYKFKLSYLQLFGPVNKIWLSLTTKMTKKQYYNFWTEFYDWIPYLRTTLFKQWKKALK